MEPRKFPVAPPKNALLSASHNQLRYPGSLSSARGKQTWFTMPLAAVLLVLPIIVLLFAPQDYRLGMLLAYANMVLIGVSMIYFIRRRTFEASVPIFFLVWFMLSWPAGSIYFGLFDPNIAYNLQSGRRELLLDGSVRLQAVSMLFLIGYLGTVVLFNRNGRNTIPSFSSSNPATTRMVYFAALLTVLVFSIRVILSIRNDTSSLLGYFMSGTFQYLYPVPLILGALLPKMSRGVQIGIFGFLAATTFVFVLFSSRFFAVVPWAMILFGYLFFAEATNKKKLVLALIAFVGFPLLLVIGDTVRNLSKGKLHDASLEERQQVFTQWGDWLSRGSVLSRTFTRVFSESGHAIVTRTPEEVPYLDFDPQRFTTEFLATVFIPNRFYFDPYYTSTFHLNTYGHLVNEETSEELSLPGSLWMLGGALPVLLGSIAMGLLHTGVMQWIRRATKVSPYKSLFYLTMIAGTVVWAFNLDLISDTRSTLRGMVFAIVLWHCLVSWILGRTAVRALPARAVRFAWGGHR